METPSSVREDYDLSRKSWNECQQIILYTDIKLQIKPKPWVPHVYSNNPSLSSVMQSELNGSTKITSGLRDLMRV